MPPQVRPGAVFGQGQMHVQKTEIVKDRIVELLLDMRRTIGLRLAVRATRQPARPLTKATTGFGADAVCPYIPPESRVGSFRHVVHVDKRAEVVDLPGDVTIVTSATGRPSLDEFPPG